MQKTRRIGVTLALTTAALGTPATVATAPAVAVPGGPQPVSTWLRSVRAGTGSRVSIPWATSSYDECGFHSRTKTRTAVLSLPAPRNTGLDGLDGPGGPGRGRPGGPNHDGPGAPGHGGPGQGSQDPKGSAGPVQDGPGQYAPGAGQGRSGDQPGTGTRN